MSSEYIGAAWRPRQAGLVQLRDPIHLCVKLLPVAPSVFSEEQMEITGYIFNATHVALASLVFILVLIPVGKLLRRTGHHPVWCILALFPVLNLGALWFHAFKPWPIDAKPTTPLAQPPK